MSRDKHGDLARLEFLSKEISRAEDKLKLALDVSGLGIWVWEIIPNILHWDTRMISLFCLEPSEFKPTYAFFESRLHPDDVAPVNAAVQAALKGEAYNYSFRVKDSKGGWRKIRGKGSVVVDANNKPIEMIGVCLLDDAPSNIGQTK